MRGILVASVALAVAGLGGCAYHQEVAALRMARPAVEPAQLAAYAKPETNYPSVGGDILEGTRPNTAAAYDATSGERVPPPDAPR